MDNGERPILSRKLFEAFHRRVTVAESKPRKAARNFDCVTGRSRLWVGNAPDTKRSSRLRLVLSFHCGQFHRLALGNLLRRIVTDDGLYQRTRNSQCE